MKRWFGAVLACALAACGSVKNNDLDGGGDNDGAVAGTFTLAVDPTSLTLPIAGSMTVAVTVTRTGTVGDIALTTPSVPANLTASLSPTTLTEGTDTAELTITAVGGMAPATGTVTVHAAAGSVERDADVSVSTTTISVTGTIRGGRAGVRVGIIGKPSQLSGAGGAFSFTDVTPPYDLYTFNQGGCGNGSQQRPTAFFFDDLTRPDPVVSAPSYSVQCLTLILCQNLSANVTGTKSGTGNNTDTVTWAYTGGGFGSPVLNTNGTFSGTAGWCFGNTSTGSLQALQYTRKPNNAPNTFLGYASAQATYTNGQPATTNLAFVAVSSSSTVTGTVNSPAGYPTPTVRLVQSFGTTYASLWQANTTAIDASFPIIAAAGGSALYATAALPDGSNSSFVYPLTTATTVNVTLPAAAVLTAPVADATAVTATTPFTWTSAPDVISQVTFRTNTAHFLVWTTKSETTIPVIPELAIPAATPFSWSITSYGPYVHVNDAAAAAVLEGVQENDFEGPAHSIANSVGRSFTTQ